MSMDFTQSPSNLPLNFLSHTSAEQKHVGFQLLSKDDHNPSPSPSHGDEEDDRHVSILGHPVTVKRRRDKISSSSSSFPPPKRPNSSAEDRLATIRAWGSQPLQSADPEIFDIMEKEKTRQIKGIELIASENYVCRAVMEALGSHLTNKYSEGIPNARYYTGNQFIDQIETICCQRALAAFGLDKDHWGVNVQPYSCTSANFAVYTALLLPGNRIMGLDSPSGGHLSHGYYTPGGKNVSASSIFFESLPYKVNPQTGYIDYDKMEEKATDFRPKILICGGSSYPRDWDYARFRHVADKIGAVLMCDMAHISGLISAKELTSPFDYCDIVTSTTHKSLRGPRGGMVFYRKGRQYDYEERINFAVHPSLQGGPHNNHVAALAIALKQVASEEYAAYIRQVKSNAQALAAALMRRSCRLVTGGTDNHLILWDLSTFGITGKNYERVCEICLITVNKTAIYGGNGAVCPAGVRIGTPAMTTRGCVEGDFETVSDFLVRAAEVTVALQRENGKCSMSFLKRVQSSTEVAQLRTRVEAFSSQFAMPASHT